MSDRQKLDQMMALYWSARALKTSHLRRLHPDWSDEAIEARVREIFLLATT